MLKAHVQDLLSRVVVERSTGTLHCEFLGRHLTIDFAHGKIVQVSSDLGFRSSIAALAQSGRLTWSHFDALWARGEADGSVPVALEELGISVGESQVAHEKLMCRQALLLTGAPRFEEVALEGVERFPTEPFLASLGVNIARTPPPAQLGSPSSDGRTVAGSQQSLVLMLEGESLLRKREFKAAADLFAKAHAITGSGAALGAQAWAIYVDPTRKPEQESARHTMHRALEIDQESDALHYRMGMMLRLEGQLERAETHFAQAVRLNAGHLEAAQELAAIEARRRLTHSPSSDSDRT